MFCPSDSRIRKILEIIEYDPTVSAQKLADLVKLSNSRLSHLFRAQTGRSLGDFLTSQRLERAALLLQNTEMPVKEITYTLGYRQEPSFIRAFRKKFDCSPTSYRRERQRFLLTNGSSG